MDTPAGGFSYLRISAVEAMLAASSPPAVPTGGFAPGSPLDLWADAEERWARRSMPPSALTPARLAVQSYLQALVEHGVDVQAMQTELLSERTEVRRKWALAAIDMLDDRHWGKQLRARYR